MYSYCSDAAFIKRAQGLTALDCAKAGEAVAGARLVRKDRLAIT